MLTPKAAIAKQSKPLRYRPVLPHRGVRLSCAFLLLAILASYSLVYGQETEKVKFKADALEGEVVDGEACIKLCNNVVFTLKELTITAANALYYEKRKVIEAEGATKIVHHDGSVILADRLIYDEASQIAQLRGNVVYQSGETIFYTDHLDYNIKSKQGQFVGGGRLVEGDNVLTSETGSYNDLDKAATFEQQVKLVNRDYSVQCDKLHYNSVTKVARFKGKPSHIESRDGKQHLKTNEWGEYNTERRQSTFGKSKVETDQYIVEGALINADQAREEYKVTGHVRLFFKEDEVIVSGDYAELHKDKGMAKVYGNALMTKLLKEDKLYISADVFLSTENKTSEGKPDNTLTASKNVKLYKEDFQGKADSMVYKEAEEKVYFYGDTIFWSNNNQLTADEVYLVLQNKSLHELHMKTNVLLASEDELGNFNQLQGRDMVACFKDNKLAHIEVDGNAESIYFSLDDKKQLQGMNHLRCSHMRVGIEKEVIASIAFNTQPVAAFYPPHLIPEELKRLANFNWQISERPTKQEVVEHGYGTQSGYKAFKLAPEPASKETLKK